MFFFIFMFRDLVLQIWKVKFIRIFFIYFKFKSSWSETLNTVQSISFQKLCICPIGNQIIGPYKILIRNHFFILMLCKLCIIFTFSSDVKIKILLLLCYLRICSVFIGLTLYDIKPFTNCFSIYDSNLVIQSAITVHFNIKEISEKAQFIS